MNFFSLLFHSLSIISVFREAVIIRTIVYFIFYLFLVYNNLSLLTLIPVAFLFLFLLVILNISRRSSLPALNKSLDNIESVDNLGRSNGRQ